MKRVLPILIAAALTLGMVPAASATLCTFLLSVEFSGATPPAGAAPWLKAVFDDSIGGGMVRLTMTALNLSGTEFVDEWNFNLDPSLDPTDLSFSAVDVSDIDAANTSISTGVDAFMADGDGNFDIMFDFPPPPGAFAGKFTAGEEVVYDISISAGAIDANSFCFPSAGGGGNGTFQTAAHVQSIGDDGSGSGWIGDVPEVPEPATMLLLGLGLSGAAGMGFIRRRK